MFATEKIQFIKKIVSLIKSDSEVSFSIIAEWSDAKGPFLKYEEELRHLIEHYLSDQDIHEEDHDYRATQLEKIDKIYHLLLDRNSES